MTRLLERAWVPLVMVIVADFQSSAWWAARGEHARLVAALDGVKARERNRR